MRYLSSTRKIEFINASYSARDYCAESKLNARLNEFDKTYDRTADARFECLTIEDR